MRQLNSTAGIFGPFNRIQRLSDRWLCDGGHYQDGVIGTATIEDYIAPTPVEPAPLVPDSVPMASARITLLNKGWLTTVTDFINAMTGADGEKARIYFEYSQSIRRDNPIVAVVAAAQGWTEAELDQLFIDAGKL